MNEKIKSEAHDTLSIEDVGMIIEDEIGAEPSGDVPEACLVQEAQDLHEDNELHDALGPESDDPASESIPSSRYLAPPCPFS